MFDTYADVVIALSLVASIVAAGCSLRYRIDVRSARDVLGEPAFVAAAGAAFALALTVSSMGVVYVLWFAAAATHGFLATVSPLLFATWLVLLFTCTRECLRAVLLLTGCAPTGAAAP
jgi:hypothetical protein